MRIERLKTQVSEELVARPSSNKGVSLKNQKRAELLRRIEELDRRLALLNSERKLLDEVRRIHDSRSSNPPTLWQRRLPR